MSSSSALHLEAGFLTKPEAHSFDLVCWSVRAGDSPVSDHSGGLRGTCDDAWLLCKFPGFFSSTLCAMVLCSAGDRTR